MRQPTTLRRHVLILYFGLTFGFSWLLFIPAALLLRDRPGASPAEVPGVAPLQTAGAAVPSLVAIALASLLYGRQGLRQLFGGFRRWRVGIRWYLTAIFLAPLLTLVALGLRALLDGDFAVDPDSELGKALADVGLAALLVSLPLVFVVSLFTSPLLEEPGWRGFALPHLQHRLTALAAGVLLGFIEGLWQLPIALAGREPLLPYFLGVTGSFTILTWIFNSTGGSLVMALLYHASLNVAAGPLQFDPGDLVAPLLTWLVVSLLVLGYGARDLARRERFTWERGR
jgi:uncharacterized protein